MGQKWAITKTKKKHYFSNVDYVNHYIYITSKSTLRGKRKKERKKEKTPTNQFGDGRLSKIKVSLWEKFWELLPSC